MPKFRVSDTITYTREWTVEARDEEQAIRKISKKPPMPDYEEQTDSTPYEAEELEDE